MNELSAIINYIEEHLEDNIDMKKIEQLARVSEYNFQKIFSENFQKFSHIRHDVGSESGFQKYRCEALFHFFCQFSSDK